MNKKKNLVLIVIFALPVIIFAQNQYTLQQCLSIGLQNNFDILIANTEKEIAKNNATIGNAGFLPSIDLSAGYSGIWDNIYRQRTAHEDYVYQNNRLGQNLNAGIYLNWTIFKGFSVITNYDRLRELQKIGELNATIAIKNFVAEASKEYYNYIQQNTQLKNLQYAVQLSRERLRIVQERYTIGSMSKLDLQQAKVDFNADSSKLMKQKELVFASKVNLNRLMGVSDVEKPLLVADTTIEMIENLPDKEQFWQLILSQNALLFLADKDILLGEIELKSINSTYYPYLKLNLGYGYNTNYYNPNYSPDNQDLGFTYGATLGFSIFDGLNRQRQKRNATLELSNKKINKEKIILQLYSNFSNIWMAYQNNKELFLLEKENLSTAKENFNYAIDRYKVGTLSGIELREAQNSLLEAEQRLIQIEYNIKICEISLLHISGKMLDLTK